MIVNLIEFLRDRPKLLIRSCYLLIALVFVWGLFVDTSHAHTWAEKHVPGFWSIFGLLSCALLIGGAWVVGKLGIMTKEDYYND